MRIEKASTFGGQFVEARRLDLPTRPIIGDVAQAHVVGKDQYDIGLGRPEGRNRCQAKGGDNECGSKKRFHGLANKSA